MLGPRVPQLGQLGHGRQVVGLGPILRGADDLQVIVVVAAVVLGLGLLGWDRMRLGIWIRVRALILGCNVKLCTSSTR